MPVVRLLRARNDSGDGDAAPLLTATALAEETGATLARAERVLPAATARVEAYAPGAPMP